ncbi:FAD-dependent monooxygenase [Planctomonas sp. JC2975]|uniref:NAD(P)/FAD-dependent oxidoreductase n=1 Tax=Planctomonas sp. JC2975 TaxID=2729626 RepID=UPI0014739DC5|nr:NAD(P)/FAD-dependent oxidoreductase [Planctomonas sp. JC2975]NNC12649.1 FAD-dependent monooxygenase [Planctomonas sp. JC2975]
MTTDTQLAIVGGGPIGLVTALLAANAGLEPVIIEPRATPIDKACGEGLMPGAWRMLHELGLDPSGAELHGIAYVQGRSRAEHRFRDGCGRGVERTVLHATIAARVAERGIPVVEGRIDRLDQNDAGVTIGGPGLDLLGARYVIGADGLHSRVRELAGLAGRTQRASRRRFGLRRHYAIAPWSDLVEVRWTPKAELYVTPLGPERVGVAVLARRGVDFDRAVGDDRELAELLRADAAGGSRARLGNVRGAGPLLQRTSARTAGRVLLVGDASGYVDALTGEGLRVGIAQARAAIAAISAGDPSRYERDWMRITRDFRRLTTGLVVAAGSPLRGTIVPMAVLVPPLYGGIVERLAR